MTADLVARLESAANECAKDAPLLREAASALRSSGEAVAMYQVRSRLHDAMPWREVSKREYDDHGEFPGFPDREWERRMLYLHPATVTDEDVERAWRPIAEIRPKHGDPVEFAEHELVALVDVEKVAIGTKLYAPPASTSHPAASAALERV